MSIIHNPKSKICNHSSRRSGFSLIEILVVVAIATSIVLVVGNFGQNVNGLNNLVSEELQSRSDVNQIVMVMTNEIQSAGFSANGAYPVDSASTSSFAFYADIAKNGLPDHVRYFLSSSTIYKGVIAPVGNPATYPTSSEVVTDAIDNVMIPASTSLFSYYNSGYTGTETAMTQPVSISAIRIVAISFYAKKIENASQPSAPQYFTSFIDIRNVRSN